MPIHWNIMPIKLDEEIALLKKANKVVTHIIPVLIENKPGDMFNLIVRYALVFEDAK